jgi:hypothetical protein
MLFFNFPGVPTVPDPSYISTPHKQSLSYL